mmetsp:Transcript_14517/g.39821  ORF Transcript_14517/g.39821 Transcript_14517/m.39821 type:complete len:344 (+) Transcript_14517:1630-2661(+)
MFRLHVTISLLVPSCNLPEIVEGRSDDITETLWRNERCRTGGSLHCAHDIVLEEINRRVHIGYEAESLLPRLHLMNVDLLHVVREMPTQLLTNGVVCLSVVAEKDHAELRVESHKFLETFKLFLAQRCQFAAQHELHTCVDGTREQTRHCVKAVHVLEAFEFLESASFHEVACNVRTGAQGNQLTHLAASLKFTIKGCDAWVRCVLKVALVDASRKTTTRAFHRVIHIGEDLSPGATTTSVVWTSRGSVAHKVQTLWHTLSSASQVQHVAEVTRRHQCSVRHLQESFREEVVKNTATNPQVCYVLEDELVHRLDVAQAVLHGLEFRQVVPVSYRQELLHCVFT